MLHSHSSTRSHHDDEDDRLLQYSSFAVHSVLAIRIETYDSTPTVTPDQLETSLFGSGTGSLRQQMQACSASALILEPSTPSYFSSSSLSGDFGTLKYERPGIWTFAFSTNASNSVRASQYTHSELVQLASSVILNLLTETSNDFDLFDVRLIADHVLMVVPPNVKNNDSFLATGDLHNNQSIYLDTWALSLSGLMHELGHNLGLYHAATTQNVYGDTTGYMGVSELTQGGPLTCYNAQNHWQLGWYIGNGDVPIRKHIQTTTTSSSMAELLQITAFVDHHKISDDYNSQRYPEVVLVKVNDFLYMHYNRAKDYNVGTRLAPDQLVIVLDDTDGAYSISDSAQRTTILVAALDLIDVSMYTAYGVTIEVCDVITPADLNGETRDSMIVSIGSESQTSACPSYYQQQTEPTASPEYGGFKDIPVVSMTTSPTTISPTTRSPTSPQPTTKAPTASPTTRAPVITPTTVSPTISPTRAPVTVAPTTRSPIADTVSPTTISPTMAPTTAQPTLAPTTIVPTTAAVVNTLQPTLSNVLVADDNDKSNNIRDKAYTEDDDEEDGDSETNSNNDPKVHAANGNNYNNNDQSGVAGINDKDTAEETTSSVAGVMSAGAITGISLVLLAIAAALFWFCRRRGSMKSFNHFSFLESDTNHEGSSGEYGRGSKNADTQKLIVVSSKTMEDDDMDLECSTNDFDPFKVKQTSSNETKKSKFASFASSIFSPAATTVTAPSETPSPSDGRPVESKSNAAGSPRRFFRSPQTTAIPFSNKKSGRKAKKSGLPLLMDDQEFLSSGENFEPQKLVLPSDEHNRTPTHGRGSYEADTEGFSTGDESQEHSPSMKIQMGRHMVPYFQPPEPSRHSLLGGSGATIHSHASIASEDSSQLQGEDFLPTDMEDDDNISADASSLNYSLATESVMSLSSLSQQNHYHSHRPSKRQTPRLVPIIDSRQQSPDQFLPHRNHNRITPSPSTKFGAWNSSGENWRAFGNDDLSPIPSNGHFTTKNRHSRAVTTHHDLVDGSIEVSPNPWNEI